MTRSDETLQRQPRRLGLSHPDLAPAADLSLARRRIAAYRPRGPEQRQIQSRMLAWIDCFPHTAHLRSCLEGHLTASALVVDPIEQRVLPGVALREASEESGLEDLRVIDRIIDLDIHEIPEYGDVPAHLHLDTRYLVIAPAATVPLGNHESNAVRMMSLKDALKICDDASLLRMLEALAAGQLTGLLEDSAGGSP